MLCMGRNLISHVPTQSLNSEGIWTAREHNSRSPVLRETAKSDAIKHHVHSLHPSGGNINGLALRWPLVVVAVLVGCSRPVRRGVTKSVGIRPGGSRLVEWSKFGCA